MRNPEATPALRSFVLPALLGALLLAPITVLRAPLWPFYPLVFLCGVLVRARGGPLLQALLPLLAALLGPFLLFVSGASGAADFATVLHESGARAIGEYVRQYVLAGAPLRAWVLLPSVVLLGYVATDPARLVIARTGVPRHAVRNTLLGLSFGAIVFALPRVRLRLSEAREAWRLADRARDDDRRLLARASAGMPTLDRTPLVARDDVRVVLIVGSSGSRWDWSLYGYPRATNAPIASAADSTRLVLFTRAEVPPSADGAPSSAGLSSLHFLYRQDGDRVVPLMHTLARAGIATTWIHSGSATSRDGDALTGGDVREAADDADLAPALRTVLSATNGSRLVVLEARAGRYPWCGMLPPSAREEWNDWLAGLRDVAIWGTGRPHRAALGCYDAAMRHASETIASAIRVVDVDTVPTLLLYVPARGADAWSSSGPAASTRDPRVTDVSLLVYPNGAFASRYPGALEGARRNRDARIATASVHDAVLDAFGIPPDSAGALAARNSILDASFDATSDSSALATLRLVPGDSADLAHDSTGTQREGRLCAHRGNSVLKYLEGRATYHCVEMDVVLDSTARDDGPAVVFHPPTPDPGLPLYDLLAHAGVPRAGMWLDVKNLTARNAPAFLARLATLVPPALRGRVIVETGNRELAASPAAGAIADSGFVLSYYLDTELGCICSRATNPGCEDRIRRLATELHGGSFTGLSFDARGRAVARALRDRIVPRPVLNTWTPMDRCGDGSYARPLEPPSRDSLLGDVQKYLVRMRSAFAY
jgi:hypothetical protein